MDQMGRKNSCNSCNADSAKASYFSVWAISFTLSFVFFLPGSLKAQSVSDALTNGRCAPIVGQVQGDVIINCAENLSEAPLFESVVPAHQFDARNVSFVQFLQENGGGIVRLDIELSTDVQGFGQVASQFCTGNYHSGEEMITFKIPIMDFTDIEEALIQSGVDIWSDFSSRIANYEEIVRGRCSAEVTIPTNLFVSPYALAGGVHGYMVRGTFAISTTRSYNEIIYNLTPIAGY